MGCIYGKRELLLRFRPYKVRPAPAYLPDRWETGTQIHEGLAGVTAAVDYLADLGRHSDPAASQIPVPVILRPSDQDGRRISTSDSITAHAGSHADDHEAQRQQFPDPSPRRAALLSAYRAIRKHEMALATRLIAGLLGIAGVRFYGISDPARFAERCPTVAVRVKNLTPLACAKFLGDRGIFTWDGNFYALNITERLGVEKTGGLLRIGLVHYNTAEEVDRLLAAMRDLASSI
jgi:selenocysteine lyase/cysteine desulfurase